MGNEPFNADLNNGVTQKRYNQPNPADATNVTSIPKEHNIGWLVSKYTDIAKRLETKADEITKQLKTEVKETVTDLETNPGHPWVREVAYAIQYPDIASHVIGDLHRVAVNFQINIGNAIGKKSNEDGSHQNAIRHTLWQALITMEYGIEHAERVGNAHEHDSKIDLNRRIFDKPEDADAVIDLLNNKIGRKIGEQNKNATYSGVARIVMEEFYKNGLWIASGNDQDGHIIQKTKITTEEYDLAIEEINKKGEDGLNK